MYKTHKYTIDEDKMDKIFKKYWYIILSCVKGLKINWNIIEHPSIKDIQDTLEDEKILLYNKNIPREKFFFTYLLNNHNKLYNKEDVFNFDMSRRDYSFKVEILTRFLKTNFYHGIENFYNSYNIRSLSDIKFIEDEIEEETIIDKMLNINKEDHYINYSKHITDNERQESEEYIRSIISKGYRFLTIVATHKKLLDKEDKESKILGKCKDKLAYKFKKSGSIIGTREFALMPVDGKINMHCHFVCVIDNKVYKEKMFDSCCRPDYEETYNTLGLETAEDITNFIMYIFKNIDFDHSIKYLDYHIQRENDIIDWHKIINKLNSIRSRQK